MTKRGRKYGLMQWLAACFPAAVAWIARGQREEARLRRAKQQATNDERAYLEQKRLSEEYARGYLCGWQECFHTCVEAIEDEIGALEEEGFLDPPSCPEAAQAARADAALAATARAADARSRTSRTGDAGEARVPQPPSGGRTSKPN